MRRYLALLTAIVLLIAVSAAATAAATRIVFPLYDLRLSDPGEVAVRERPNGTQVIVFTGLEVAGPVCANERDCDEPSRMAIKQDMQIVIDFTGAGVRGRTRGDVFLEPLGIDVWEHAYFRGPVRGRVACVGSPADPCDQLDLTLRARRPLRDAETNRLAGFIQINAMTISLSGCGAACYAPDDVIVDGRIITAQDFP